MKFHKSIGVYVFLAGLIADLPSIAQARGMTGHMGLHPLGSAIRHHQADSCGTTEGCGSPAQTAPRP